MNEQMKKLRNRYINVINGMKKNEKPTDFDRGCMTVAQDFLYMLDETAGWYDRPHQDKT